MIDKNIKELGFETRQQYNFPNIINVCVTRGTCPCQCVHCPVGISKPKDRHSKFGNSAMTFQLFKKIVKEMSAFQHSTMRIHGVGEPMLWKELLQSLKFASENNVRNWLFTCLVTKNMSLLSGLARYCNIIEISINSYGEDDYRRTKGINAFSLVKNNIALLRKIITTKNLATRIIVSRVESEDKQHDSNFIDYWKMSGLVDDAFIRSYHNYNEMLENKFNRKSDEIIPCLVHWSRFNIDCDGTVVICFNEIFKGKHPEKTLVLGNIKNQKIAEIWHCEKLNLLRRAQLEKDYSIVNFTNKLPCIDCFSCQPLVSVSNPTSENQISALLRSDPVE